VGDTIRRPTGPHSPFVHALLLHLERRTFAGAPRYLGLDSAGREILSYLPGDVPVDLGAFSPQQLTGAARLLRELHDATLDSPNRGASEVVCHGDPSPCNCVFRDARPIAFIDFDAAHAGARREDVGYAAWLWLDLGNDDLDPIEQGRRLGGFVAAYGALDPDDAIRAVLDAQKELSRRPAAPPATQEWARDCLGWSTGNRVGLESGLTLARQAAF
jgi:Phosphotransferase enzyme family